MNRPVSPGSNIQVDAASSATQSAHDIFQQGLAEHHRGQLDQAQALYRQVLRQQPNHVEALHLSGVIAAQQKNPAQALELIGRALQLSPHNALALHNQGNALNALKQHQAAVQSYDKALAIQPDYANAHYNRGIALSDQGRYQAAIASFEQALRIKPDYPLLPGLLLHTKMKIADWREVEAGLANLAQRILQGELASVTFIVLALTASLEIQHKAALTYTKATHPSNLQLEAVPARPRKAKIRVGYFSMDFKDHPVSHLMARLFELHDRDQFEIYAFSYGTASMDGMRQRLQAAFDKFIDVENLSDLEIAQLARQMEIDIAVDLAGYTGHARTGIFAVRAAPIQVNYMGYPGSMGAEYMDYLIADPVLIPEVSQRYYSEKIAYLPHSYQANDCTREIADKSFSREALNLPPSGFVFCCFNNTYKITPQTFDRWMRILHQVPGGVLWLSESTTEGCDNLRAQAQDRGVEPSRLVFARKLPQLAEHLARHRAADLFIDTWPYNAHTTASDALWAGLPVLTCTGESFASRVAASLLTALGLPELIATNSDDYEALAIDLATHPERLKLIRDKLQHNRLTMPLFDSALFTRHIENAYTQMVERHHSGLAPDHLYVEK